MRAVMAVMASAFSSPTVASAILALVMQASWMCAVAMAAMRTCSDPTEPDCSCPLPTEPMASFMPVMEPDASCRAEIRLPSSVSAAVPSVKAVYFFVRQS